jgi:methionyl aminopeptidase
MTENNNLKNQSDKKKNEEDEEEEKKHKIESLTKAGKIAQEVKKYIKPKIQIGTKVLNLIENTEKKIVELDGGWAFPVNVSINNIAAHYTSPIKDDDLTIKEGDIVKIDLGVHVDGYIVDTAFTISFNDEKSLENNTKELGKKIEDIVKGFKFNPIKELGGHQIERWTVHGKKRLPELGAQGGDIMEEGEVFAIEIFASTGEGTVHNTKYSYIYELNPYAGRVPLRRKTSKQILGHINKNYKTLPFAERWLAKDFRMGVMFGLQELVQQGKIQVHYVLAEQKGEFVAQSEQTILITEDGFKQLT